MLRESMTVLCPHTRTTQPSFPLLVPCTSEKGHVVLTPSLPAAMPKATASSKHTITALNETTGLRERISISAETRKRYANAGKARRYSKPAATPKVTTRPMTLLERIDLHKEIDQEVAEKNHLNRLYAKRRLLDRISEPHTSLLQRLSPANAEYVIPGPLPKGLDFCKKTTLIRINDLRSNCEATYDRLAPLIQKLEDDEDRERNKIAVKVPLMTRHAIWNWWEPFQELATDWDVKGRKLTNKGFRQFAGACNRIGKVSFADLDNRLVEICVELKGKNITFPDVRERPPALDRDLTPDKD